MAGYGTIQHLTYFPDKIRIILEPDEYGQSMGLHVKHGLPIPDIGDFIFYDGDKMYLTPKQNLHLKWSKDTHDFAFDRLGYDFESR